MQQSTPRKPTTPISSIDAYRLGQAYYFGLSGKPQNYVQALPYLMQAAQQGHTKAQSLLSECYAKGHGVNRNDTQAAVWLIQAASKGDADAQYDLGIFYQKGRGVQKNFSFALYWFDEAAKTEPAERNEKSAKKAAATLRTLGVEPVKPTQLNMLTEPHFQSSIAVSAKPKDLKTIQSDSNANKLPPSILLGSSVLTPKTKFVSDPQLQRIQELEALLAAEKARTNAAEARAATLEVRLAEIERPAATSSSSSSVPAVTRSTTPGVEFFAPRAVTPPAAQQPASPVVQEPADAAVRQENSF